jgi:hypothetical protein
MVESLKYYDEKSDPPWIKALAEVRRRACHEGWCYHHVQAIIVSIDSMLKRPWATGVTS